MIETSANRTRLCPHCANTIAAEAAECFYCKADVSTDFAPSWLQRDENSSRPAVERGRRLPSISPRLIWPAATLAVAIIAFFMGGYFQRGDRETAMMTSKQLQAKDLMLQSQESQLTQARQKLAEASTQLAETKSKLEASQKELAVAQQRVSAARRAADAPNRASSVQPVTPRASVSSRTPVAAPAPQPAAARQSASAGVYVTTRATAVHEDPSPSARVISKIESGTRINVVGASGGWLEVRSRRGNPPGYVRADDARATGSN
jgi:hypothetical protein